MKINSEWLEKNTRLVVLVPLVFVVAITLLVIAYEATQSGKWKVSYEINGAIGDLFGGILNPIVALLALVWLRRGVRMQEIELAATKNALSAQVEISAVAGLLQVDTLKIEHVTNNLNALRKAIEQAREHQAKQSMDSRIRAALGEEDRYQKVIKELEMVRQAALNDLEKLRKRHDDYEERLRELLKSAKSSQESSAS